MGVKWFIGGIFTLSGATYLMALFIGDIMNFFKYPPPPQRKKPTPYAPDTVAGPVTGEPRPDEIIPAPRNMWRMLGVVPGRCSKGKQSSPEEGRGDTQ
jgi:hypothetical protein